MTTKSKRTAGAKKPASDNGQKEKKVDIIKLSEIQLDKYRAVQQKELAFQNEIVAIRTQKTDLLEVILDSQGYTKEQLSKVTNIILNDKNELEITS